MGSGCAALVYEVVWFPLLQLVIGSSAVSLGVLLGTFMGGMCHQFVRQPYWASEYGSSEDAGQFKWLDGYSPYRRVKPGTRYPAGAVDGRGRSC